MTNQTLSSTWKIPTYAQPYLTLTTDSGQSIRPTGDQGEFMLDTPSQTLNICWGDAPLTQIPSQPDSLDWDGQVRLGGFATAIHMTQLQAIDYPLAIITLEAYPLLPDVQPFAAKVHRDRLPYAAPDFLSGVDDDSNEGVTTWIAEVDSPLVGLMQDAMNQAHRVYAFGQLASEAHGWHHFFALPILLESVTTFMR